MQTFGNIMEPQLVTTGNLCRFPLYSDAQIFPLPCWIKVSKIICSPNVDTRVKKKVIEHQ